MGLEDLTGTDKFIDDFVITNPIGATDVKGQGDNHLRGIKNVLNNCFEFITGKVTATHTELNVLDGITSTTAQLNDAPDIFSGANSADAGGTVDAITATMNTTLTALTNNQMVIIRAAGANATTTPTFSPDTLTAKTIVANGNNALRIGNIKGADHEMVLRFNSTNDNWELLNPFNSVPSEVFIETWTPTAVNFKDFTFDETIYSGIKLVLENIVPATDSVFLRVRLGHTNGGTIISSTDYWYTRIQTGSATPVAATAQDNIALANTIGTGANEGIGGTIETISFPSTVTGRGIKTNIEFTQSGGGNGLWATTAHCFASIGTAFDTVQLYWSSGNFEVNGSIQVHGILK
jgi:hypothetical protein